MTKKKELPSPEYLRERLDYDPETGRLYWKYHPDKPVQWNTRYPGTEAGSGTNQGYIKLRIMGITYCSHRVIYSMIHGNIDKEIYIDHIDGNPSNNRLNNLRRASINQNRHNTKMFKNNSSGYKGVRASINSQTKEFRGWRADICINSKIIYLGEFNIPEEAHEAYKAASLKYHGEFGRTE